MTDRAIPGRMTPRRDLRTWGLLAAAIAVLLINGAIAVWNARAMDDSHAWVTHTHEVLENSQRLLSALQDAETGQRGFLITGIPDYLEPYQSSLSRIHEQVGRLKELTKDNPVQQQRLDEIRPLIERKLDELRRTVELRRRSNAVEATHAAFLTIEDKATMDALRAKLAALDDIELGLMDELARRFHVNFTGAILQAVLGTLASVALVAWAFQLLVSRRRERERAAEMFAGEGERLRTTLTSIGDGVIVTDDVGRVTLINKVAEDLTGWKRDDAAGQPLSQVFHIINEYTRQQVVSPVDRVLREGVVVGLANHTALIAKDGREVPISDSGAPIRDLQGRINGVVLVFRDQTEERRTEMERARLAAIVESTDDVILSKDLRGTILTWNAAATRVLGYRPDEAVGQPVNIIIPPDRQAEEADILSRIRAGERVAHFETKRITKSGELLDVSVTVSPVRDHDGHIVGASKVLRDITEQKRARVALHESEERLRLFVNYAPAAVAMFDRDMRFLAASRRYAEDYRLGQQEIVGRSHYDLFPEIPDRWRQIHQRCLSGAVEGCEEDLFPRADGSVDWVKWEIRPWRTATGEVGGVVLFSEVITERKQEKEALRESEERLRLALDAANAGTWEWDLRTNANTWSDGLWKLYGLEPHSREASYAAWRDSIHTEDRERAENAVQRAARTGTDVDVEWRVQSSGGTTRWLTARGQPERDEEGVVTRYRGIVLDTTEQKRAAEAVERSRKGLSRLAEASLQVVRETDLQGMLQSISEAALTLTNGRIATCGHGDIAGRAVVGGSARAPGAPGCRPGEMFVVDRGGVHMDLLDRAEAIRLTDAQLRAHPRWWGGPDGHAPLRGLLGARMVGRNGKTNGMILVTDKVDGDFTEEDESLLRQLATIASLALQHVEARIAVEEADKAKNHFLAMLSHELRNPLAPIQNSLYILDRAAAGSEPAKRAEAVIQRQVGHLTHLVDDLLDMTRISRGKIQLQPERLDLNELIQRAIDDHRSVFDQNGLQLLVELPAHPLWIDGDPARLVQVVGNLLQNSAKFTELGGRISVSLATNDTLRQAVFRVRDTGIGIEPGMLSRVFEPFSQADTTLARSKGGLGLGLALVKSLVEMHGGGVTVESEGAGKGAEFVMRLPLNGEVAQPRGIAAPASVRPQRILIIEDNVDSADSLREVLELDGHSVEVAYSGRYGIEKARAHPPDVILCDIGLPGIDGYQVAQAIRGDPLLGEIRLVALTGYAAPEDVSRSRAAGFNAHVSKPPSIEALKDLLAGSKS